MSEVFISYATSDRSKAKALAAILVRHGWSVWWDRKIPIGQKFSTVIQRELNAAKCVIVLWSAASVESDWVMDEASVAAKRGILVPALIEDIDLPFGFKRIQTARLIDWQSKSTHSEIRALLEAVADTTGKPLPSIPKKKRGGSKAQPQNPTTETAEAKSEKTMSRPTEHSKKNVQSIPKVNLAKEDKSTREQVFISYSREDQDWFKKLETMLLKRGEKLLVWEVTQIKPDAKWKETIEEALSSARVAVLLVSRSFLASDFIVQHELPPLLLEAAKKRGLTILLVAVSHSHYLETELANYRAANDPRAPLEQLHPAELDRVLNEICEKIAQAATR